MEAHSFTAIGAISINKLWQLMTKNASINELNLSYLLRFFMPSTVEISVVLMEMLRHKLALIIPRIEAVGASIICLSPTLAYFNFLEQWWSPLKYFLLWFAQNTTSMIDTIIAVALTKHPASIFKKLGKLMADNVPHNSSSCCYCNQRKSAKAK